MNATNENQLRERIDKVMTLKNITINRLAKDYDDNMRRMIHYQLGQGRKLTWQVVEVVINNLPNVSLEWLFRGNGDIFITQKSTQNDLPNEIDIETIKFLCSQIRVFADRIQEITGLSE